MGVIDYFKYYQGCGIYLYAKVWSDRQPPLSETVNFSTTVPQLSHREYNPESDDDQLAFQALFETWEWIDEAEFKRAYRRATAELFQIYIDGNLLEL